MSTTVSVLTAISDRIGEAVSASFDSLKVVEGTAVENITRDTKGFQCYVHYRSERPVKVDASGAHFLRGIVVAITLVKTMHGRTRRESYEQDLNNVMDDVLDAIIEPMSPEKWWGPDENICGIGPNGITAMAAANGDFIGRLMLFNVLVR